MQYYVVWTDGQKFGPANLDTLNQWIKEGRVVPDTVLESVVDGTRVAASQVSGLDFNPQANILQPQASAQQPAYQQPAQTVNPARSYYVLGTGGQKYGPADVATLNQWAQQGRLTAYTELEDASSGLKMAASAVPGLSVGGGIAAGTTGFGSSPTYRSNAQGYPAANPYSSAPTNYPRGFAQAGGSNEATWSIICSVLGIFCCMPLAFVGLGLAYSARNKGAESAGVAIVLGWISSALALLLFIGGLALRFSG